MSRPSSGGTGTRPSRPAPQWKPVSQPARSRGKGTKARSTKSSPPRRNTSRRPSTPRRSRGGLVLMAVVLSLVAIGGLAWMTMWFTARGEVVEGTTVAGTDIGGVVPNEAERILDAAVTDELNDPIRLMIDGQPVDIVPAEAGVTVDVAASVARADVTESVDPWELWDHFTGGEDIEPVVTIHEKAFRRAMHDVDKQVGTPPRNARVTVTAKGTQVTPPRSGLAVDRDAVRAILLEQWYGENRTSLLTLSDTEPEIGDKQVRTFTKQFLDPALAGPVTLRFGSTKLVLPTAKFGPTIKVRPVNGELEGRLDQKAFNALVAPTVKSARTTPVNARWALVSGRPTIVKGHAGRVYSTDGATSAFLGVLLRKNDRTGTVEAKVTDPAFTYQDAAALRIERVVGEGARTTRWSKQAGPDIGAISGVVIKPGASFNLNDYVGATNAEMRQAFKAAASKAGLSPSRGSITNSTSTGFMIQAWASTDQKQKRIRDHHNWWEQDRKKNRHDRFRTVYQTSYTVRFWGA